MYERYARGRNWTPHAVKGVYISLEQQPGPESQLRLAATIPSGASEIRLCCGACSSSRITASDVTRSLAPPPPRARNAGGSFCAFRFLRANLGEKRRAGINSSANASHKRFMTLASDTPSPGTNMAGDRPHWPGAALCNIR